MVVIGNKQRLAFELVPVTPSWEIRYAPEMAAWAGTAIWVNGMNLCSHILPGSSEIQEYFYVPLGPLVDWFVRTFPALEFQERASVFPTTRYLHQSVEQWFDTRPPRGVSEDDWLDAREAWWSLHFLRSGADGALLPELALVRDDERLVLDWVPPHFVGPDAPSMRWATGHASVPWHEGREILDRFTAVVAAWFRESPVADTYAWAKNEFPLMQAEPGIERALELFTGHTVDGLGAIFGAGEFHDLLRRLHLDASSRDPAASPHCQVLRDLSPTLSPEVREVLTEIGQAATHPDDEALKKWKQAREIALDASRPAESPEQAGYLAAPEIRHALDLDGQPLGEVRTFLRQLGLEYGHQEASGGRDQMMVALRDDGAPVAATLQTPRTAKLWGQRFEACRALGHVLLDPVRAGTIGAASGPYAVSTRRRRSGAFAAELLLPEPAIASMSGHALDGAAEPAIFATLLDRYGIGARTAAYHLWNRGWLSSPEVRDELIEQYATTMIG